MPWRAIGGIPCFVLIERKERESALCPLWRRVSPAGGADVRRPVLACDQRGAQAGPGKPILITETAVAPGPPQVGQIRDLFTGARERHLAGLIWFDVNNKEPWALTHGSPALAAFKEERAK